jgi:OOP family OmpA-OmpF porin
MKQLKLVMLALFSLATLSNVNAQDENNPWVIGFGLNTVDFYGSDDFSQQINDLIGNSDWNVLPSISKISAEKYLADGFSLQVAGSINKIESMITENASDFFYFAIDLNVKYDVNNLIGETAWFDPYVYLGGGYTSLDNSGEAMLSGGLGFNTWLNENIGLNFQTGTKKGFTSKVKSHYQTSVGFVIKFGGTETDGDGV